MQQGSYGQGLGHDEHREAIIVLGVLWWYRWPQGGHCVLCT